MAEKDLTLAPLKVSPYKHQQQAIKFACRMFGISEQKRKTSGVALLMQMGTGKSLTAIGIAGTLYENVKATGGSADGDGTVDGKVFPEG